MKRLFLAAAIVLGPAVGLASAEYMVIKIDLNKLGPPLTPSQLGANTPGRGGPQPARGGPPAAGTKEAEGPPLWASAYLELKRKPEPRRFGRFEAYAIEHPFGKAFVPNLDPKAEGSIGSLKTYSQASVSQRFLRRRKSLEQEGKTAEKLLLLAQWALEHGLTDSFLQTMDDLAKVDAKHPAVRAVAQIREAIARPIATVDPQAAAVLEQLKAENYREIYSDRGHYTLFTDLPAGGGNDAELKKWAERLEDSFRNFFYWFAARGTALPVPTYRLVAAVVGQPKEFERKHDSYSPGPIVANGFLVHRGNVLLFGARPVDEAYDKLEKNNRKEWEAFKVGRDELLSGDVVKRTDLARFPEVISKFQTLALLQKSMEKESARAAATHEGARQLMAATGLLPRGALAARWVHSGMASFFETPYHAFYFGVGLPHWNYLIEFKHRQKTGELARSSEVLLKTITDRYFIAAQGTEQHLERDKEQRETLEPVLHDQLLAARSTAWALTYYLAKHRLASLEQYLRELASLPRDLEFDDAVLQGCFARAFGLTDAMDSNKLDMVKLARLAEAWYSSMEGESLDLLVVQNDALAERAKAKQHAPHRP